MWHQAIDLDLGTGNGLYRVHGHGQQLHHSQRHGVGKIVLKIKELVSSAFDRSLIHRSNGRVGVTIGMLSVVTSFAV